jgi:cobalt-zinc-cadmium efflux system membrane fusion protein
MMILRNVLYAAIAIISMLLAGGCKSDSPPPPVPQAIITGESVSFPPKSPQLEVLKLETAVERDGAAHRLTGRIVWDEERTVRVFTPFAGRIEAIRVKVGDRVQAGQVLATIGSPDFGQAQVELHKAEVDSALTEKNFARQRDLLSHGVAAAKDVQSAEAEFQRAKAELGRVRARAAFYGADSTGQRFPLRTPLAGVVIEKNVNPGQEVRPDQMTSNIPALFVVTDPTRLWVQLDATEHDLGLLHRDQRVLLRIPAYPDEAFAARIDSISDFIDPVSRAVKVRATVDNPARRLKGEMFVSAEIWEERPRILMIPAASTFLVGAKHYAFIEQPSGQFTRVEVEVGKEANGWVIVTSGIRAGERIVTSGALFLQQLLEHGKSAA